MNTILDRIVECKTREVRLAAERATAQDIAEIEDAFAGMSRAVHEGGDYVTHDLRFHQGLLHACRNPLLVQMSKALSALLRTSFELSASKKGGPADSLPLHRAVLDAVIAHKPAKAEKAILTLIDDASQDIEQVLASRRKRLPRLNQPASLLKGG
jgi:DNA-binding FadR family transcriptional regulator